MMPVAAGGFTGGPEREPGWHKAGDELHRHSASSPARWAPS